MQPQPFQVAADDAEAVDVAGADPVPIDELDAQLEAALGAAQEIVLVQADQAVEGLDRGNGGLAHADRSDRLGFDKGDDLPP